jgi:hypothetical protein
LLKVEPCLRRRFYSTRSLLGSDGDRDDAPDKVR